MASVQIAETVADFEVEALVDGEFTTVRLSDYNGSYLVLFFYPKDFSFVCPTELTELSDRIEEFERINCHVIAVSTDSTHTHLAWCNLARGSGGLGEMRLPIAADVKLHLCETFGVLKDDGGVAYRGMFIIDGSQRLRQITINDMPVGRSIDEILRLVQAFQYTDTHGEVCPAGWHPGVAAIRPSARESKEFFRLSYDNDDVIVLRL